MQLAAVLLARVIFFVESIDLNPRGDAYYPDFINALVKRYNFMVYPQKFEDFDEQKGVTLTSGKAGDRVIEKVVIYNWGLTLETRSSTGDAEALLEEALNWATQSLRLNYKPEMIKRKTYVSHVTFYSDAPLLHANPIFDSIADKLTKMVSHNLKSSSTFQAAGIFLNADPLTQTIPVQMFSIERRQGVAFSEGKYFSAAPVPTDVHLELIEEFERAARAQVKK